MLMQLVCVDRRYQRMNCFNIRELQGVLKRKFFTDLVNTNDHRDFLNQSIIGLRFKLNDELAITPDLESFFNLGTTLNTKSKVLHLENNYLGSNTLLNVVFTNKLNINSLNLSYIFFNYFYNTAAIITSININTIFSAPYLLSLPKYILDFSFNINVSTIDFFSTTKYENQGKGKSDLDTNFSTENINVANLNENTNLLLSETSNNIRFTRINNPLISYDYKCGHYLGIWESLYPSLMTSYIEVARGIRKAPWFLSDQFNELLLNNYTNFTKRFTTQSNLKLADVDNWYSSHVSPIDNFFNINYIFNENNNFINFR
jgi:hypothetical protein